MDKKQIIEQLGNSQSDVGSTGVQIGFLTIAIKHLTGHLKQHPKDLSTQRGLKSKVELRKKLIKYLKKTDLNKYHHVLETLGIRH